MSVSTVTTKPANGEEKEVFTPTVPEISGEVCDACGSSAVAARYQATKGDNSLFFCAHHVRAFESKLKGDGFSIFPEDVSYDAAVAK